VATEGLLTEVLITERGSNAAAVAAVGATELDVADLTDFTDYSGDDAVDPATQETTGLGVIIDILGERYTVDSVTPGATDADVVEGAGGTFDDASELTPGTLTLTEPLRAQVDEDDPVWLVVGTEVATDAYALVSFPQTAEVLGDETDSGDVAQVPIPYGMRAQFPEGLYDPPVPIVVSDDLTTVLDAPGVKPTIDGSTIINLPGIAEPTEPPDSSPAVEVHGTIDSLVVEVLDEYAGTTTLDFHISTTPDFTPTAETLAGSSRSAVFVIVSAPVVDGDGNVTVEPLKLDTVYYVRTVARNIVGPADPGPIATGVLDPSKVSEIVAARLVAGFVLAGAIQVGNITIDPTNGIVVPLSNGGTIHIPADGSPAQIDAYINARGLTVENDLTINGFGELAADLLMSAGVTDPTVAPVTSSAYKSVALEGYTYGTDLPSTVYNNTLVMCTTAATTAPKFQSWNATTGARIATDVSPVFPSNAGSIHAIQYGPGATAQKLFVLTYGPSNWYLFRLDLNLSVETWVTIGSSDFEPNGLQEMELAVDPSTGIMALVFRRYDSAYNLGGIEVSLRDSRDANMTTIGSTQTLSTLTGNRVRKVAFQPNPSTAPADIGKPVLTVMRQLESGGYDFPAWAPYPAVARTSAYDLTGLSVVTDLTSSSFQGFTGSGDPMPGSTSTGLNHQYLIKGGRLYTLREPVARTVNAAYTWYDGNASNGTHETKASPAKSFTVPKAQWPTVTMSPAPEVSITDPARVDVANQLGFYAAVGTGAVKLQRFLPIGVAGLGAMDFNPHPAQIATATSPPATNGFLVSENPPGRIRSTKTDAVGSLIDFKGDGTWRLGSLTGLTTGAVNGAGRIQAGVSTYRSTPSGSAPGAILGQEATPTVWSNSLLRGFTYSAGAWTCQPGAAGAYLVWAKATWAADTVNDWGCGLQIWKNGAQMGGINDITLHSKAIGNSTGPTLTALIEVAVGDQLAMSIWQGSGTARTPNGCQFYLVPQLS
jgi:hypothetical protein